MNASTYQCGENTLDAGRSPLSLLLLLPEILFLGRKEKWLLATGVAIPPTTQIILSALP